MNCRRSTPTGFEPIESYDAFEEKMYEILKQKQIFSDYLLDVNSEVFDSLVDHLVR